MPRTTLARPPPGRPWLSGGPVGWWLAQAVRSRDLLIAIYLAWAAALVVALVAFGFPDRTSRTEPSRTEPGRTDPRV